MQLTIYTDGGFSYNHDVGSWAFIAQDTNATLTVERYAVVEHHKQTSQVAEIMAIYKALLFVWEELCQKKVQLMGKIQLTIVSDSQYCCNTLKSWIHNWANQNWQVDKQNLDLWKEIYKLRMMLKSIDMKWVKGHAGHTMNERVDRLTQIPLSRYRT